MILKGKEERLKGSFMKKKKEKFKVKEKQQPELFQFDLINY